MNKILIICGPTATGKTALAFELAATWNGELINADSRQVYMGLDLLTGKDIPPGARHVSSGVTSQFRGNSHKHKYFLIGDIRLWMVDEMYYGEEFSVAHYQSFAEIIIKDIIRRNKLPIIVGGTGLYINSILFPIETASVPPDDKQRSTYAAMRAEQLQKVLREIDASRLSVMNFSDKQNPRRLVRAIEIAQWNRNHRKSTEATTDDYSPLIVGLTASADIIKKHIHHRIINRWSTGVVDEVKNFNISHSEISHQRPVLGLKQIKEYLEGTLTKEAAIKEWLQEESAYAKRQMTWFKKQKNIHWFTLDSENQRSNIQQLVQEWYTKST